MSALIETLGGIGLFLFGMAVMTSGLRKLAGDRLRMWLARSTRNPSTGVLTGATVTALIQSSSATTVAAIGFVGAGLMTFTESLGVIFGANIGTTITGWMVAVIGFKLKLSEAALVLLFVAAFCYLFKQHRKLRGFGKALAGFCLIFLGIGFLQQGLAGYRDVIDLSRWQVDSLSGRLVLVLIGITLTLITQSSSATVATALTALNASLLDLPQAAAVIIGADIGTTATAALATIGGTTASRRTGFAHVIYNLMTGIAAFGFLPFYLELAERFWEGAVTDSPEMVAVAFHSLFNLLGVVIVLPLTRPFGRFIERLFPEKESRLAMPFEKRLLEDPGAALGGLAFGSRQLAAVAVDQARGVLGGEGNGGRAPGEIGAAIESGRDFAVKVGRGKEGEEGIDSERVFACLHLLDHVERLVDRSRDVRRAAVIEKTPSFEIEVAEVVGLLSELAPCLRGERAWEDLEERLRSQAEDLEEDKHRFRRQSIEAATRAEISGHELDERLDARRWLRRLAYHAARIAHYGREAGVE